MKYLVDLIFWFILIRTYFYFKDYENKFIREIIYILIIVAYYCIKQIIIYKFL